MVRYETSQSINFLKNEESHMLTNKEVNVDFLTSWVNFKAIYVFDFDAKRLIATGMSEGPFYTTMGGFP